MLGREVRRGKYRDVTATRERFKRKADRLDIKTEAEMHFLTCSIFIP